jgi:uncharacterized membrane protein YkoI
MRFPRTTLRLATLILVAGVATICHAKSDEVSDVSKLPRAVQKTVREQVADGKIVKIQKENTDGKIVYGVACAKGEKKWQVEVAPDGRLLLRAEEMNSADLSSAVQKTVEQSAANGKIESIAKVTENGQSYYEAAVTFNGLEKTFIVGVDGKLIDTQMPDNEPRLPESRSKDPLNGEPKGGGYGQQ